MYIFNFFFTGGMGGHNHGASFSFGGGPGGGGTFFQFGWRNLPRKTYDNSSKNQQKRKKPTLFLDV